MVLFFFYACFLLPSLAYIVYRYRQGTLVEGQIDWDCLDIDYASALGTASHRNLSLSYYFVSFGFCGLVLCWTGSWISFSLSLVVAYIVGSFLALFVHVCGE